MFARKIEMVKNGRNIHSIVCQSCQLIFSPMRSSMVQMVIYFQPRFNVIKRIPSFCTGFNKNSSTSATAALLKHAYEYLNGYISHHHRFFPVRPTRGPEEVLLWVLHRLVGETRRGHGFHF